MLTKLLRQDRPVLIFLGPLLVLLLFPGAGSSGAPWAEPVHGYASWTPAGMPLYIPVARLLAIHPLIGILVSMLLITMVGHRMDRTGNDSEVFERRNHLSSMLLPLLLALLPHGLVPGPALVGALPMLFAVSKPWSTMNRAEAPRKLFDAGLLLGLAALFYLPYAFLVVVLWATLAVTRPFQWREYVLPAVGGAAILFIGWGVAKLAFPGIWDPVASFHFGEDAELHEPHWMYRVVLFGILAILAVAVLFTFQSVYSRSIIRVQNIRASFLAFAFAMGLLALFAWWLDHRIPPALLAVPASMFLAFPLLHAKRTAWSDAAIWSLFLLAVWARYGP